MLTAMEIVSGKSEHLSKEDDILYCTVYCMIQMKKKKDNVYGHSFFESIKVNPTTLPAKKLFYLQWQFTL